MSATFDLKSPLNSLSSSPDGSMVVVGGREGLQFKQRLGTFFTKSFQCLKFSPLIQIQKMFSKKFQIFAVEKQI